MGWWDYASLSLLGALFTFGIYAIMRVSGTRKELDVTVIRNTEHLRSLDDKITWIDAEVKRARDRLERLEQQRLWPGKHEP